MKSVHGQAKLVVLCLLTAGVVLFGCGEDEGEATNQNTVTNQNDGDNQDNGDNQNNEDNQKPDPEDCEESVTISDDITDDMTLDGACYLVTARVRIEGAELTIEPGVIVEFEDSSGFQFRNGGSIKAEGEEGDEILLTSVAQQPDSWAGLRIEGGIHHSLDHVILEYAGESPSDFNPPALQLTLGEISITNSTFRYNGDVGLELGRDANGLSDFSGNSFVANGQAPLDLYLSHVGQLNSDTQFSDHDYQYIHVNTRDAHDLDATWQNLDLPYKLFGRATFKAQLTIEPGTTVKFENTNAGLKLDDGGVLIAEGNEGEEILFTGAGEYPGSWRGLLIEGGQLHSLDHVIVEYAGEGGGGWGPTNMRVTEGGVSVTNSTFRYSSGPGIRLSRHSTGFNDFYGNKFVDNDETPIEMVIGQAGTLTDDVVFEGHERNYIFFNGGTNSNSRRIASDSTIPALDIPYRVQGRSHISEGAEVTIEPGAVFEFTPNSGLKMSDGGVLIADGTDEEIVFRSITPGSPGSWLGVVLDDPTSGHVFNNVRIENGGENAGQFNSNNGANLILNEGTATVINSEFNGSSGPGIYFDETDGKALDDGGTRMTAVSQFEAAGNSFEENTEGPIDY